MRPIESSFLSDLIEPYVTGGDPGLAAGVYREGALVAHAAAGQAVIEHSVPHSAGSLFDIASASKHFTAACVLLLQRDGALSLDEDVRNHLPELSVGAPVTLRQCLSHTAGLREYYGLCRLAGIPVAGMDEARLMGLLAGQADLDFPPSTSWSYSNSGFVLAAATIRRLTGKSIAELAVERIFEPLGMQTTRFRDDLSVVVPRLSGGYTPGPDGGWRRAEITEETVGDGGVVTSLDDLGGWQDFVLTGAVLGADIRDGLLDRARLADGRRLVYSLGLEVTSIGPHEVHWHSGSIDGFRSAFAYLIGQGLGVAVMANRDDIYPAEVAMRIAGRLCGFDPPPPAAFPEAADAVTAQPALTGVWYSPGLDLHMEVLANDDGTVSMEDDGHALRFHLRADGTWAGVGHAVSDRLRPVVGELWRERIVGEPWPEVYVRLPTPAPPPAPAAPSVPPLTGAYFSEELRAFATLVPADADAADAAEAHQRNAALELTVGLAPPRLVRRVGPGVWAGDGLTVHAPDGTGLSISLRGARRCRFSRVDAGAVPPRPRGL